MNLIERTERFLKEFLEKSQWMQNHEDDKNYRLQHSRRVANIAGEIARREGMDVEALIIAGLLHDVSYGETWNCFEEEWLNHGRYSARIAGEFLEAQGMEPERIQQICYGIAIHVDGEADFPGEKNAFALSVGEADNIDRFDVYRIYEGMVYDRFRELSLEKKISCIEKKLSWIDARLADRVSTETAREMLTARLNFQREFFTRLRGQLEKSATVDFELL